MFSVKIRKHIMVAHSLPSAAFGPAQHLHGATYVVDATFSSSDLDENNIVIDIDLASRLLEQVLQPLNYQNLDNLEVFHGKLTTTEFLAYFIHQELAKVLAGSFTGNLLVTLGESHVAWASYEGRI